MMLRDETRARLLELCPASDAKHLTWAVCFGAMAMHSAWDRPVWDPELTYLDTSVRRAAEQGAVQILLTHDIQLIAAAAGALQLHGGISCLVLDRLVSPRQIEPLTLRRLLRAAGRRHATPLAWVNPQTKAVRMARSPSSLSLVGPASGENDHMLFASSNLDELCGDDRFLLGRGFDTAYELPSAHCHYETVGRLARRLTLGMTALRRDIAGTPCGALCWSWVSARSAERLRRQPVRPTSFYEMNDGRIFLLEAAAFADDNEARQLVALFPSELAETERGLHRDGDALRPFRRIDDDDCLRAMFAVRRDRTSLTP
jgi:hypothetical protein